MPSKGLYTTLNFDKNEKRPYNIIKVSDFSIEPVHRYMSQGKHSGEHFRLSILLPEFAKAQLDQKLLVVDLEGTYGYTSSFLEEAFGGLVRNYKSVNEVVKVLRLISTNRPYYIDEVCEYLEEALDS